MTEHRCIVCYELFTEEEWEERHSTPDGEDCHERCCPECLEEAWYNPEEEALTTQERNPSFRSW